MNSQNGNPTPEQRKEKAREMLLMKELKAKKAQEYINYLYINTLLYYILILYYTIY
jgi:hypothetical protein